jgi:flagellar basal-body rod protein FlgF
MDNAIYVGLSRQMMLERELDIVANNLANVDTNGFKFEDLISSADKVSTPRAGGPSQALTFVQDGGVARDYSQGAFTQTGGPLDVAIDGKGFFQISTASGTRYTRDGRFKLDSTGKLVTQDGDPVQGAGGDIQIDPTKGQVSIAKNGVISQSGNQVGKLQVVSFDSLAALSKDGANLFENVSNVTPTPSTDAVLEQGMLEGSNVQPINQITRLIEINRAYDAITTMMSQTSSLSTAAIQRLGAVNPS